MVIAGKEYGTQQPRWAAKGPLLLGVRAVIARASSASTAATWWGWASAPRVPCGDSSDVLGLTAARSRGAGPMPRWRGPHRFEVTVRGTTIGGGEISFRVRARLDTPEEVEYYRHGGILHYV